MLDFITAMIIMAVLFVLVMSIICFEEITSFLWRFTPQHRRDIKRGYKIFHSETYPGKHLIYLYHPGYKDWFYDECYYTVFVDADGMIHAGCFYGNLEALEARIHSKPRHKAAMDYYLAELAALKAKA